MRERADVAEHAHRRVLAHGAGVHGDDVRLVLIVGHRIAHAAEIPAQHLAVGLVLLAAVGVYHGKALAPAEGGADARAYLFLPFDLPRGDLGSLVGHGLQFPFRVSFADNRVFYHFALDSATSLLYNQGE